MIGMCIVDLNENVTLKKDVVGPGDPILTICGNEQPPRDYITSWVWEKDGHDKEEVRIYISKALDSRAVLNRLAHIFENADNVQTVLGMPPGLSVEAQIMWKRTLQLQDVI